MKKNSNYNKTYDIFDEGFHDRYRYNLYNPFGYTGGLYCNELFEVIQ